MSEVFMDSWALFDGLAIGRIAAIAFVAVVAAITLLFIVLRGVALFGITKKRNLGVPVLSFFPGTQSFVLGHL